MPCVLRFLVSKLHCSIKIKLFSDVMLTHTFPCLISKNDTRPKVLVELEIQMEIEKLGLTLLGWYHSHPSNPAMPSLRDCDSQLEYQIKMRGPSEISYIPCTGVICCKLYFFELYFFILLSRQTILRPT